MSSTGRARGGGGGGRAPIPSARARAVARRAAARLDEAVASLAALVACPTVAAPPTPNAALPAFRRLAAYLGETAHRLGFDAADHGAAVVIGLGDAADRLGLLTHGDVQPADRARWRSDPFILDATREPGRLIGRGVEDDKASIATALQAMRAVREAGIPLRRRVELMVSMTEESDWTPFRDFLRGWDPPALNVALDAKYPVVTAEKGAGTITLTVPPADLGGGAGGRTDGRPRLLAFRGGEARTRVPASALAVIDGAGPDLAAALRARADRTADRAGGGADAARVSFDIAVDDVTGPGAGGAGGRAAAAGAITVRARGVAAHSATPEAGRNAVTHLAALLAGRTWPRTPASRMARLIDDLVGVGHHGAQIDGLACTHPFMGPLTLVLTELAPRGDGGIEARLNIRCPVGRDRAGVDTIVRAAVDAWAAREGGGPVDCACTLGDPYYVESAPHVPVLVDIFRHYAGGAGGPGGPGAGPVAIGGGTQARLLPNGVNFGPSMPDAAYTGHTDHEFVTVDQLRLNLLMQTAMLVELAGG